MNRVDVFEPRTAALIVAAVSAAALIGAYLFQYVGDLAPCQMCLWQRPPYYIAIIGSIGAYALMRGAPQLNIIILVLLAVVALALAVNAGIGVFHAGVEWKLWKGPATCGAIDFSSTSVVRCDEAAWRLLGLSLAGYSALISAGLTVIAAGAVARSARGAAL